MTPEWMPKPQICGSSQAPKFYGSFLSLSLQLVSSFERQFEDVRSFLLHANFDLGFKLWAKISDISLAINVQGLWIMHQLLHFQNLPDMRHKSALSWKIPTLQFALDSFQAADRIKQRLLSFCGHDGQLFPCGPNSSGIIPVFITGVAELHMTLTSDTLPTSLFGMLGIMS